ncbi:MAG: hypothetical protein LQ338_001333 [Usnochroma carphineum]|nr:MAG: hypothetical protein LQ338_001333 [Usnochroma carphineum]
MSESLDRPDLALHCGNEVFEVHRAIVCHQSKLFSAVIQSDPPQARPDAITIEDESSATVERLMSFLYTGSYGHVTVIHGSPFYIHRTETLDNDQQHHQNILLHISMYVCGERYGVGPLKELAQAEFKNSITQQWPLKDFPGLVAEVYSSTPRKDRGLRDIILEICRAHINKVLADPLWTQLMAMEDAWELSRELLPIVVKSKDETIERLRKLRKVGYQDEVDD